MSSTNTTAHQAVLALLRRATAAQKALEEQVAQMSSHGRNLEDSLRVAREKIATLEDQASTMSSHDRALHARFTRASESETPSTSRLKSIKLDVAIFGGVESDKILRWFLQASTAADAQRISDDATRVAFAMSHLKGRAEDWAFSKRFDGPPLLPIFRGKSYLQEFIHDLRFLAANINDEESLPGPLRVTVFMDGLNQGPARTQLFRAYPNTFEEAASDDRACFNCGRPGHFSRVVSRPALTRFLPYCVRYPFASPSERPT
ncbi:hypothetical protein H257_16010 [Aphanomyces astaci]|uniref:CCHC-type domain-containing protein n=1 Tax=Aphanomyces astaci TaxID=112090 RepID=W4FK71_APHAT|nr:hypothetical protein H257_16010 [Aphanomyces astaci]ETV67885.1 hypothetical protein H257_16010 [Aphanomyces astaci]|eukprot:XP_009842630.1 hypothetical protein H257_16010 [Aphanomyces astaci]